MALAPFCFNTEQYLVTYLSTLEEQDYYSQLLPSAHCKLQMEDPLMREINLFCQASVSEGLVQIIGCK